MPNKPKSVCCFANCSALTDGRFCESHRRQYKREIKRSNDYQGMYNARWRKIRKIVLRSNPLCTNCTINGIITTATEVDHIEPHKGDLQLFYDMNNLQPLCKSCHSRKTMKELKEEGKM